MGTDFNEIKLGQSKDAELLNPRQIRAGVTSEVLKEDYQCIFNAYDTGKFKGVLEQEEVNKLVSDVYKAKGRNNTLSENEVRKFIDSKGLTNVNTSTFFAFLKSVVSASRYLCGSNETTQGSDSVMQVSYYNTDNHEVRVKNYNKDGFELSESDASGKKVYYTRTKNDYGGYNITKENGDVEIYTPDNTLIGGKDVKGEYNSALISPVKIKIGNTEISYNMVKTYQNGSTEYYNNGIQMGGKDVPAKLENGISEYIYKPDKNGYTKEYKDVILTHDLKADFTDRYDNENRIVERKSNIKDFEFTVDYNSDSSSTQEKTDYINILPTKNSNPNVQITIHENKNGTLYFGVDKKNKMPHLNTRADKQGNFYVHATCGDTLEGTIKRLGISETDREKFIKSNKDRIVTVKRNGRTISYFNLSKIGTDGNIFVPQSIAKNLDLSNLLVDEYEQYKKWQKQH